MYSLAVGACASAAIGQLSLKFTRLTSTGAPCEQGPPIRLHDNDHPCQQCQPVQALNQARCCNQHGNTQHPLHQFPTKESCQCCPGLFGAARYRTSKHDRRQQNRQSTICSRPTCHLPSQHPSQQRDHHGGCTLQANQVPNRPLLSLALAPCLSFLRSQRLELRLFVLKFRVVGPLIGLLNHALKYPQCP